MSFNENPNNITPSYVQGTLKGQSKDLPEGPKYDNKGKPTSEQYPSLEGKTSSLHSLSVLHYTDFMSESTLSDFNTQESRYFDGANPKGYRNPTGSQIVSKFNENAVEHARQYKRGDFLYVDHYGKVPNNHLITLRRFPQPSNDNLMNNLENPHRDVSRMLAYIDGEGNTFDSVFSFTTGLNWKKFESEIQTIEKSKTGWGAMNFMGYADTTGSFAKGKLAGSAAADPANDPYNQHQNNYTWGPIDVVKEIMTRDVGVTFEQNITLKFRYAVRSYDGISTKVAFLDIMGNMLNMVTNKAPFWGGAVRFTGGGGHSGPLGDPKKLKNGDIDGFLKSFIGDITDKLSKPFEGGILNGLKTIAGNIGAKFLGGGLDKLGRPEMFSLHSLLTANPTGEWHLTVGNPFNPTMMIGNLIMEDASWGFEGPFTADDVPSYVTLEVKLKHAMPRDKYGIQRMFHFGTTRFYGSDVDFKAKTYYRNNSMAGKKGPSDNTAKKITEQGIGIATGQQESETLAYAKSVYQGKKPAALASA